VTNATTAATAIRKNALMLIIECLSANYRRLGERRGAANRRMSNTAYAARATRDRM
jgi:hypothetical protein